MQITSQKINNYTSFQSKKVVKFSSVKEKYYKKCKNRSGIQDVPGQVTLTPDRQVSVHALLFGNLFFLACT